MFSFVRMGLVLIALLLLLTACGDEPPTPEPSPTPLPSPTATAAVRTLRAPTVAAPTPAPGVLAQRTPVDTLPAWQQYQARLAAAAQLPIPVLRLTDGMTTEELAAQEIALQDPRLQRDLRATDNGAPLRNEIFGVYPVRADDLTPATAA